MAIADTDHALEALGTLSGGLALAYDANGLCQIVIEDLFVLNLIRIDAAHIRLLVYIEDFDRPVDTRFLLNLATSNHPPPKALDQGALALHPDLGLFALTDLVDVTLLEPEDLERRILGFAKRVAYWMANGDNLFDDVNALESQVHRSGAGMSDADYKSYDTVFSHRDFVVKA